MLLFWMVLAVAACGAGRALPRKTAQEAEPPPGEELPAHRQARRAVAAASNVFGVDLFEALRAQSPAANVALSPLSVCAALALAHQGARGATAQQLARALHLPDDAQEVATGYHALFKRLNETTSEQVLLRLANKVYTQKDFGVKEDFRQRAMASFRAGAEAVDFEKNPEGARDAVNAWVSQATAGLIPELFPHGAFGQDTIMLLLNAIYFKGNWATPFEEQNTMDRPFRLTATTQVNVPTMRSFVRADINDLPQINATLLQLLYNDNATRMLIFIPDEIDGLEQLENNIRLVDLNELKFNPTEIDVQLPKFKISTQLELKNTLMKLGVEDLFNKGTADLTGISEEQGLYAAKVIHHAVVEVTEKGTEAAAASGIELVNKFGASRIVDRPFLFMVTNADNVVLFIGRVTNPLLQ